jgi:pimeloyl-ACP methyl ester carboxylesterase
MSKRHREGNGSGRAGIVRQKPKPNAKRQTPNSKCQTSPSGGGTNVRPEAWLEAGGICRGPGLDSGLRAVLAAAMSDLLLAAAARRGLAIPPAPHAVEVLGQLAASVYLRPRRDGRKVPREMGYLRGARPHRLRTVAGELAAWRWGPEDAPLVGLLHGWEGHGAQLGAFAAPLVAAGFGVLAFDAPGHGDSPGEECSAPLIGRLVLEMEQTLGGFHALVAHSMGAAAAAMAATHGSRPRGLVFLAPPLSQLERLERLIARFGLDAPTAAAFCTAVARRSGLSLEESDMYWVARRAPCPLLALHDPDDTDASYAATAGFVAVWRGAELVPCPGRGHVRIMSTPDVVRRAVEFVRALSPA